jgi:hypothetical protein
VSFPPGLSVNNFEAIFVGEKREQVVGKIGVARQKSRAIGGPAGRDGLEIPGDGVIQPLLTLGQGRVCLGLVRNRLRIYGRLQSWQGIEPRAELLGSVETIPDS